MSRFSDAVFVTALLLVTQLFSSTFQLEDYHSRNKRAAGTPVTISTTDSDAFITTINTARGNVLPIATQMPCLVYDQTLATQAQTKATSCVRTGQTNTQAVSFDSNQQSLSAVFTKWSNEEYDAFTNACFDNVVPTCADFKSVYNDQSTKVGCATAKCDAQAGLPSAGFLTVCEFSNAYSDDTQPFKTGGAPCSGCSSTTTCVKNLCCNPTDTSSTSTSSTTTSPTSSSTTATTTSSCKDTTGVTCTTTQCAKKGTFLETCKATCGNCDGSKCVDVPQSTFDCEKYVRYNYCTKYPDKMALQCPCMCNFCQC